MQDFICSDYLLDSRGRDSKVWCFLPLSSLSSLAEAHAELDTIYCMCIILLSPVPKGNGSKYLMHVIRLYKNRSSLQSFSTDLLKPFRATNIQRWPVLQLYPKTDRVNIFSLWDRQTAVTVRAGYSSNIQLSMCHSVCVCVCVCVCLFRLENCRLLPCQK